MTQPPKPPSTEEKTPLLEDVDKMSPQELADYLYALAEEIISSPMEYKLKMGLTQLDVDELDNIDLTTPEGRKKLAKLFRILAEQVMKGKDIYQATVVDKSAPNQSRGR
jgi:hypothetical protein